MPITSLRDQLARDEADKGPNLRPYLDTRGKLTIGYGRNLTDKGINEHEAEVLFSRDMADAHDEVMTLGSWPVALWLDHPVRLAVLENMTFNMGITRLKGFKKMLAAFQRKDWPEAARQLRDSDYWRAGTHNRAERLAKQIELGEWQ